MKYIIVLSDGMADEALVELDGKTPMEVAHTPHMDLVASLGEVGLVDTIPSGMSPGSDTANLSVLGYDPRLYYSGRSPLEALSIGIDMEATDVSFRCNLVTLSEDENYEDKCMIDHSAGEITTEEAAILIHALKEELDGEGYCFYPGISYRHILLQKEGKELPMTPPHDILDQRVSSYLPHHPILLHMMKSSYEILSKHPINLERMSRGLRPANSIWLWGSGHKPSLPSFESLYGVKGAMISAVDLLKGIAIAASMTNITVEGATSGLDHNYVGDCQAALHTLLEDNFDFVYIHEESPDEMGHQGNASKKIQAIENIDREIVGPLMEHLDASGHAYRLLILPDHPTPTASRTHTSDPVPYVLYDSHTHYENVFSYSERGAKETGNFHADGMSLMRELLGVPKS